MEAIDGMMLPIYKRPHGCLVHLRWHHCLRLDLAEITAMDRDFSIGIDMSILRAWISKIRFELNKGDVEVGLCSTSAQVVSRSRYAHQSLRFAPYRSPSLTDSQCLLGRVL